MSDFNPPIVDHHAPEVPGTVRPGNFVVAIGGMQVVEFVDVDPANVRVFYHGGTFALVPTEDAHIIRRVRALTRCTADYGKHRPNYAVHVGTTYDDGCFEYALSLMEYLQEPES